MLGSVFELPRVTVLPDWLHPELLETLSFVTLFAVALGALLVFRFVRRMVFRSVLVGLLLLLAIGVWEQRHYLSSCIERCTCAVFGQTVQIPIDRSSHCGDT